MIELLDFSFKSLVKLEKCYLRWCLLINILKYLIMTKYILLLKVCYIHVLYLSTDLEFLIFRIIITNNFAKFLKKYSPKIWNKK